MATLAIDGVRWTNDRVTNVRWGSFDASTNSWSGKEVRTLFKLGGRTFLGPKVTALPYTGGHVGIEARVQDGQLEKSLEDLPPV
jgi:hypothetical protein